MEWLAKGGSADFSRVESRAFPRRAAAPRIYYLDAHIAASLSMWAPDLARARTLGFDHLCLPPVFAPGSSGDLFLAGDAERPASFLGEASSVDAAVARLSALCRDHELSLLLDVVLDRVAAGS